MKMRRKKDGFTLVELMIAMVSAAILALVVALILFMSYREWRTGNDYARLRRDAAFAVQLMAKEIRNSSLNGITAANNSLQCPTNAAHPAYTVAFTRNAASSNLTYYKNNSLQGPVISKGVRAFNPQKQTNGVLLRLELVNASGDLSLTNQTFISARN